MWKATRPKTEKLENADVINLTLAQPSVALVHICDRGLMNVTKMVIDVTVLKVKIGVSLIVWSDRNMNTKCVLKYRIYFRTNSSQYEMINDDVLSGNAFLHTHNLSETKSENYKILPVFFD